MSTFTATNGGSPKTTLTDTNNAPKRAGLTEGTNGDSAPLAPPPGGDQPSGDQPPRTVSPTHGDRETAETRNLDRSTYTSAKFADSEASHKRKRSDESMDEARREGQVQPERHPVVAGPERPYLTTERDPFERDQRERDYQHYGDEHRDRERDRESWYSPRESRDDRHPYSQPASAVPDSAHTEEQMGEALRRATEQDYPQTSPEGDDGTTGYSQYTPERRSGGPQSDPKKRKRNFSNRTKTGCLTCRRRKKKCDEAKPECSNCLKGGFVCEGYPPQRGGTWLKPENKVPAIQIESKDPNYKPPGAYGMPQQAPFPTQQQPPLGPGKREPLPSYRGQPLRIEPPQGRPLYTEDDRPTASTMPSASVASPDNNNSSNSNSNSNNNNNSNNSKLSALNTPYSSANVFPTPVSAAPVPFPERSGPKEYQRVPPLHDLSRTEPDMTPQSTTLPHINIMHATRTNSPIATPQSSSVAQTTAQLALSHTSQFSPSGPGRREKDEMLAGRSFFPFEKELVLERERCYGTLCRFNNSMNPNNGVSPTERARLFQEILQPKVPVQLTPTQTSPITHAGRLGENVVVEAPFTCDYGYNIQIGNDTLIGRNCTILDACEIKIGNNVVIGPNVSFYTTTMTTDPRRRQGARGACQGKPIIIEDDVFIGGSVTIMGGVKIGKGTTVGAGSLVSRSLPVFCICTGQPAKVRRGVASTY